MMEIKGKVNTAGCYAKITEEEVMEEKVTEEEATEEEATEQEAMEQIRGMCAGQRKADLKSFFDRFVKSSINMKPYLPY